MEQVVYSAEKKPSRNSAFEILRIIAILFIIAHHFSYHGGFDFSKLGDSALIIFNRTWIDLLRQLGKTGVNLFLLISAYFMVDSTRFKTKKVLLLLFEMLTFSIVLGVVFYFVNKREFSMPVLRSMILPFGLNNWWFMTYFLILYLFTPVLNLAIRAMNKKMHLIFTLVLFLIWSLLPTFLQAGYGFSNLSWFLTLYFIGSYIKRYDVNIKVKPVFGILIAFGIYMLGFSLKWIIRTYADTSNYYIGRLLACFNLIDQNNAIQITSTIILFLSFKKIQMKSYRGINMVASTALVTYLVHDHNDMRPWLWKSFFKNATYASSPYLFLYTIGVVLAVFAAGIIIGLTYRYTIEILYNKLLSFLDRKWLYKIDNIFNKKELEVQNE